MGEFGQWAIGRARSLTFFAIARPLLGGHR